MNAPTVLAALAAAALITFAVRRFLIRARRGSACCGDKPKPVRRARVADRQKSHYPYVLTARITGMTCDNCAARVENALNAHEGVWATVRVDTARAVIRSRVPLSPAEVRSIVHQAGYGVDEFVSPG